MSFIQIHVLQEFPASNPNRDDTGRNKSVFFGDAERLRISSQCLSRNLRTNSDFSQKLQQENVPSTRTMRLSRIVKEACEKLSVDDATGDVIALKILEAFEGKKKNKTDENDASALMFISGAEIENIENIVASAKELTDVNELVVSIDDVCNSVDKSIDMAFWGRMFASNPQYNRSGAMQVAHAFTTGRSLVDYDYFTAVDDLNNSSESGSAHLGERSFGSGLYYIYACIDMNLLIKNLDGDEELAKEWAAIMVQSFVSISPTGHSTSFGPPPLAEYIRVERGTSAPSSLANAFSKSSVGKNDLNASIDALEEKAEQVNSMHDTNPRYDDVLTVKTGQNSISAISEFIKG